MAAAKTAFTSPLLDLLFENAGAGLCLVAPDGTILRANAEWLRSTRFTRDVIGEDLIELFPAERDLALALHARARAGHHVDVPRHAVLRNGRETWWEGSLDPVPMEGGTGLLVTAREVTAEPRRDRAGPALSRLVQDVIDGAPTVVFLKDTEGRFITINRRLEELLGTSRERLRGKTDYDLFPREVADGYRENDRRVMETGRLLQVEEVAELADGKRHVFLANKFPIYDDAGRLLGTCGISHDITDRSEALRALRESEERHRSLFENMTEGFALGEVICDAAGAPRDFRFLEMNAAFERQSGLRIETTRGRPMREVLPQLEQSWVDTYCGVALGTKPAHRFESYNRDLDRHFEVYCFSPAAGRFGILFTDVSERKRASDAIRENEARLRRLYDSGMIGVLHFDLDGRVGEANDRFLEMVGYDRDDLRAGRIAWDRMTPPEYAEADARAIAALKGAGVGPTYEKEFIRKDGSRVAVLIGAATYDEARHRGISFVLDITDRRRAEEALARTTERLTDVLRSIQDDFYALDREWRFTFASRSFTSRIGKEPSDFVGQRIWTMFPRHVGTVFEENLRAAMERDETRRFEIRGQYTDAWYRMTAFPSREGVTVLGVEITESKRLESELHALNARLLEADRRKDEFLATLSHELRNPLAPIRNALYLLDRAEPGGQQARRAKEIANRQVAHLSRLVDDLLDVTRIARGRVELRRASHDLVALAQRTADDHRALMQERGLELVVEAPAHPVVVQGDDVRLAQVLGNLLSNAAKFTPAGGRVTLSITADARRAVIHVRDTGPGIEPELLESIFDPFTQAKQTLARSEGGLGLGLALVKGLVALHGGEVVARNAGDGGGADLVVTLPLPGAPSAAASAGTAPRADPAPRAARRRVLVVDDNQDAADTLADLVRMLGHEAEVAYDGPGALRVAREQAPDVVLCDIGLPGMDGYEVARQLRRLSPNAVRVVAVTGYAQPEDVARALHAGFDGHLAKPPDPAQLEALLRAW
jgi:PAS domain S-box-containing protein